MDLLKIGIAPVEGVADPVLLQLRRLGAELCGHRHVPRPAGGSDPVLVDVVAEVHDDVEVLLGEPAIGGVVAGLPVLARGEGERERTQRCARCRCRLGSTDGAHVVAGAEPIEVLAPRLESVHLDVHGMSELPWRDGGPGRHDARHRLVRGDLPVDLHGAGPHPAVELQRARREPGPEHDAIRARVARGDAERERVGARRSRCPRDPGRQLRQAERRGRAGRELQESAAVDLGKDLGSRESGCHRRTSSSDATPRWTGLSRSRERPQTTS